MSLSLLWMPGPPSGELEGLGTKFPHKELTLAVGASFKGQVCFNGTGTHQCPSEWTGEALKDTRTMLDFKPSQKPA